MALLSALGFLHALFVVHAGFSDDAFILFRYARNMARGLGLVWNSGEPPVEGFTSIAHVLLLAGAEAAGRDMLTASQILGLLGAAFACAAAAWLAWEASGFDQRAAIAAALILSMAPSLAAFARSGMETTLFTALLGGGVACWLRQKRLGADRRLSSLLLFAATLSRPEACGAAAILFLLDQLSGPRDRSTIWRNALSWWLFAVLILALTGWRLWYFHDIVPNTFHAKIGGGFSALMEGLLYVFRFVRSYGPILLLLAVVPPVLRRPARPLALAALASIVIVFMAYVGWIGGDYQPRWRYLVPVLPFLAAQSAAGFTIGLDAMARIGTPRRLVCAGLTGGMAVFQLALPSLRVIANHPGLLLRQPVLVESEQLGSDHFVIMGRSLEQIVPRGRSIAALAVGAIGYYSDRPILDMLGLNDRQVARSPIVEAENRDWAAGHMRGDAQLVLQRRPDFVVLSLGLTREPKRPPDERLLAFFPFVRELLESEEFRTVYRLESHELPDGLYLNVYRRIMMDDER